MQHQLLHITIDTLAPTGCAWCALQARLDRADALAAAVERMPHVLDCPANVGPTDLDPDDRISTAVCLCFRKNPADAARRYRETQP